MDNSVYIVLKSGKEVEVEKFKYITYPSKVDSKSITTVKNFDNFYLYDRLLTFIGENSSVSIHSKDIEFIKFYGSFNN